MPTGLHKTSISLALVAMAGLLLAAPATASPGLPDNVSVEIQMRSVRGLSTPPAITNRTNNVARQGMPLPQIVSALQAMDPYRSMRYIGIERFDPRTGIYFLRFLNGRQIIVVQVDSRIGRIINRGF